MLFGLSIYRKPGLTQIRSWKREECFNSFWEQLWIFLFAITSKVGEWPLLQGQVQYGIWNHIYRSGSGASRSIGVQLIFSGLHELFIFLCINTYWPTWHVEGIFYQHVMLYSFTELCRSSKMWTHIVRQYQQSLEKFIGKMSSLHWQTQVLKILIFVLKLEFCLAKTYYLLSSLKGPAHFIHCWDNVCQIPKSG